MRGHFTFFKQSYDMGKIIKGSQRSSSAMALTHKCQRPCCLFVIQMCAPSNLSIGGLGHSRSYATLTGHNADVAAASPLSPVFDGMYALRLAAFPSHFFLAYFSQSHEYSWHFVSLSDPGNQWVGETGYG